MRVLTALLLSVAVSSDASARAEVELAGDSVPARYFVGASHIFHLSDSLYINGRLLERGVEYFFEPRWGAFDLSRLSLSEHDTLRIIYTAVPSWMKTTYGTPLPEVSGVLSTPEISVSELTAERRSSPGSDISISGAKTFRFTTRSAGSSNFSQSLDLSLSGDLTPGLQLTGSISDRGYDPSYGTANSRLNELDKINLKLSSRSFTAQVGDILLSDYGGSPAVVKRVSGASVAYLERRGHLNAAVARPKGRYETVRLTGRDNTQGPYRVTSGTMTTPIVPGSETVWLDGVQLQRGANNDYVVDYPAGTIVFNVNHPIDDRSRIEVDYEPLLTAFKGELMETGGGIALGDSTVMVDVRWLREGDDKDEPFTGELTALELESLDAVGDRVEEAVRSGVVADTLGSYVLVVDSLPDSVYQYVGEGNGDYTVTFSFLGSGKGDYVFLGGAQYQYVGENSGEYLPLIIIPAAERTDYYQSSIRVRDVLVDELSAEIRQTQHDRNLFSALDDDDNGGLFYSVFAKKGWQVKGQGNFISARTRLKEARYKTRQRLYEADFSRAYFLPENFNPTGDETKHDIEAVMAPLSWLSAQPFYSRLEYGGGFRSATGGVNVVLRPSQKYRVTGGWSSIRAGLDTLSAERKGEADVFRAGIFYSVTSAIDITSDYERDKRVNEYSGQGRGTRYDRVRTSIGGNSDRLSHEYYIEDSLTGDWAEKARRNRWSASSTRRYGKFNYSAMVTYFRLTLAEMAEDNFLSRVSVNFNDPKQQFGLGAVYVVSEETRNSRGVTYLEVEQGEGNYILQDGEYVPDPDGNYIRVEEILSEASRVRRGEKSFHFSKTWPKVLVRFNSNLEEELLPEGERRVWWIVPVLSDIDQPYLFYARQYRADVRVFPIVSGHFVNLEYNEDREIRTVAGLARRRGDYTGAVALKQAVRRAFFEERMELFRYDRDSYFNGAGVIDGYRLALKYRQSVAISEITTGASYREAESETRTKSSLWAVSLDTRTQVYRKGELRTGLELYSQRLDDVSGTPSYLLTDNRPGRKGAIWSVGLRYGIKGDMRVNLNISGRHSDDREARLTGRGEFVAGF